MEKMCQDSIFGEMVYKHRWVKQEQIFLFSKNWIITVAAKAYLGKSITTEQQCSYKEFSTKKAEMLQIVEERLVKYFTDNLQNFSCYNTNLKKIKDVRVISENVKPKTLLFQQDGTTILLLDCAWDREHGIAVKLLPDVEVGSQDLFL